YFIEQKEFSWSGEYEIWDESGKAAYRIEGTPLSWGQTVNFLNEKEEVVLSAMQKVCGVVPRCALMEQDTEVTEVFKEPAFLKFNYRLNGLDWKIAGSPEKQRYQMKDGDAVIATVEPSIYNDKDVYTVSVMEEKQAVKALGLFFILTF